MHVTYLGPVPPLRGGIAQHGRRVVGALEAAGHDVAVRSWARQYPARLYPGDERDPTAIPLDGAVYDLTWSGPGTWWRAGRDTRISQLLVLPWVTPLQSPAYRTVLRASPTVPAVGIIHNPLPHERRRFDRALTVPVFRRLDGAVVHARGAADELAELVPDLPVTVVAHPPNLDLEPTPLPAGPPWRLSFLGFVREYKGLDLAIDAVRRLRRDGLDVTLTVAGQFWGPVEPWVEQIGAADLTDAVDLRPGYVPDREVASLLGAHHLVVSPYRSATQSGIVPLAHAAGRPVVATAVGGLSECIRDGVDGVLTTEVSGEAVADGIRRAIDGLDELAAGARTATSTWAEVAQAIVDLRP